MAFDLALRSPSGFDLILSASTGASIIGAGAIASAASVGQPAIGATLSGAGSIASAASVGQPEVSAGGITGAGAIASGASVGQPAIGATLSGAGAIASRASAGQPSLAVAIIGAGAILSSVSIGKPVVYLSPGIEGAGGIASATVIGQPSVSPIVSNAGDIHSTSAVGQPSLIVKLFLESIQSSVSIGEPLVRAMLPAVHFYNGMQSYSRDPPIGGDVRLMAAGRLLGLEVIPTEESLAGSIRIKKGSTVLAIKHYV